MQTNASSKRRNRPVEREPSYEEVQREHEEERETSYSPDDDRDAQPPRFGGWR